MPTAPDAVAREHVEAFIADELDAAPLHRRDPVPVLGAVLAVVVEEGEAPRSPMERMQPPTTPESPVPVVRDDDLRALLRACRRRRSTTAATPPSSPS